MSEIKRWDATGPDEAVASNRHGMFVLYSDHEA